MKQEINKYHFRIRFFGVIGMALLIALSDYRENLLLLALVAGLYLINTFLVRYKKFIYKKYEFHIYNIFADVFLLSLAIGVRGGIRSDFYLGYFIILGYVLFVRKGNMIVLLTAWIAVCYATVNYLFSDPMIFSWGRTIIRISLIGSTGYLLHRYYKLLTESEYLRFQALNLALTDALTGLYNRHILDRTQENLLRGNYNSHMILIDLDRFKHINDNYGHDTGDVVISQVARHIKEIFEEEDICIRYGGEEFLVIAKDYADLDIKKNVVKLHQVCEKIPLDNELSIDSITFSAGVCTWTKEMSFEDTVVKVDQLLYQAKNAGKNQTAYDTPKNYLSKAI